MRKEFISMRYKHSKQFWSTRYNKYKDEMNRQGLTPVKKGAFISTYEALAPTSKNPMKDIIYSAKYGTAYKNALAEKKALEGVGIKVKLEELKKMTTYDFADKYSKDLGRAYRAARAAGKSAKEAKLLISQQWFGSN
jgi:hypothetical protein